MMSSLRRIKPTGCVDDYVSGCVAIDEQGLTRKQLGELFTDRVTAILSKDKALCTKQVTLLSGGSHAATAKKLRALKEKGLIVISFAKRIGKNTKATNFYTLVEAAQC